MVFYLSWKILKKFPEKTMKKFSIYKCEIDLDKKLESTFTYL